MSETALDTLVEQPWLEQIAGPIEYPPCTRRAPELVTPGGTSRMPCKASGHQRLRRSRVLPARAAALVSAHRLRHGSRLRRWGRAPLRRTSSQMIVIGCKRERDGEYT